MQSTAVDTSLLDTLALFILTLIPVLIIFMAYEHARRVESESDVVDLEAGRGEGVVLWVTQTGAGEAAVPPYNQMYYAPPAYRECDLDIFVVETGESDDED
jgi:hypothetical protein